MTTLANLENLVRVINTYFKCSDREIYLQRKYNYIGIDLYRISDGGQMENLRSGMTKEETYTFLRGMEIGLEIKGGWR
jgi:hypothetical protein